MKMVRNEDGDAVITMTHEELGIVRYALNKGVERLVSDSIYFKSMKSDAHESAHETAENAKAASMSLESAVREGLESAARECLSR